jgi:hypothetical protein
MIFDGEIFGAWEFPAADRSIDVPSDKLILYKNDQSTIQNQAYIVADKLSGFIEVSEKLLDPFLSGIYGYKDDANRDGNARDDYRNRRNFRHAQPRSVNEQMAQKARQDYRSHGSDRNRTGSSYNSKYTRTGDNRGQGNGEGSVYFKRDRSYLNTGRGRGGRGEGGRGEGGRGFSRSSNSSSANGNAGY